MKPSDLPRVATAFVKALVNEAPNLARALVDTIKLSHKGEVVAVRVSHPSVWCSRCNDWVEYEAPPGARYVSPPMCCPQCGRGFFCEADV